MLGGAIFKGLAPDRNEGFTKVPGAGLVFLAQESEGATERVTGHMTVQRGGLV